MKKRDLKSKIIKEFASEVPDIRSKLLASCEKETQLPSSEPTPEMSDSPIKRPMFNVAFKRIAACALCLMLFISGLSVGFFIPKKDTLSPIESVETSVFLDVNPSVELRMDTKNTVIECIAANTDAETVLSGLKLSGVDMNTAITAIVGSMYVNGYLSTDANSILISVDSKSEDKSNNFLTEITEKINTVFEKSGLTCSIIAQSVKVDDTLKQRAEENGVSVGKMHLVDKMIGKMVDLSDDDTTSLTDMSIKELSLIYSTRPEKDTDTDPFEKDVSAGEVGGYVGQKDALTLLLAEIKVDLSNIDWYRVYARLKHSNGNRQMVYNISIRFNGDSSVYTFEIDPKNGEIVKIDSNMPDFSSPNGNGDGPLDTPHNGGSQDTPPNGEEDDRHKGDNG